MRRGIDVRAVRSDELRIGIQCKCGARPDIWRTVREAVAGADADAVPVAVVHCDRARGRPAQTVAVIPWADFLDLVAPR